MSSIERKMYPTVVAQDSGDGKENLSTKNIERNFVDFSNKSDRFKIQTRNFERQYAHLYAVRLAMMRKQLVKAAKEKWGNDIPIRKLCELEIDEKCIVIGTLYKDMKMKPSILKEISEKQELDIQPVGHRFVSDNDSLILEDELQRITLIGLDAKSHITGVVIAVCGQEHDDDRGNFHVEGHCFKQHAIQPVRPLPDEHQFVVLISGIELGKNNENLMGIQLLVDLLTGQLGDYNQQLATASIVRVVIAGNSLSESTQSKDQLTKAKYLTKKTAANSVDAMKNLDDILLQLSASVDTDLMPGQFDPANFVIPQQPLHRCMFPQSCHYETFHCVSNPYECEISGVRFLGTSGQSISDIEKFTEMENNMGILEKTLNWGHLAPTAPDTLGCYPYYDDDPFIINDCPHVYFAGNQPEYGSKLFDGANEQKTRLVTIPRFSDSGSCVLVNLRTLETQLISFHHDL